MRIKNLALILLISQVLIACSTPEQKAETTAPPPDSTEPITSDGVAMEPVKVNMIAKSGSNLDGTATFSQEGDSIKFVLEVENAPPGEHAVHLHEKGDCSAPDATSAGSHWNPTSMDHGHLGKTNEAHLGDIGNFKVGEDGKGTIEFTTDKWSMGGGDNSIFGKAVIVHEKADDYKTQPTGDAGGRIGCGVIESTPSDPRPSL